MKLRSRSCISCIEQQLCLITSTSCALFKFSAIILRMESSAKVALDWDWWKMSQKL